jgi:hypothetical protein
MVVIANSLLQALDAGIQPCRHVSGSLEVILVAIEDDRSEQLQVFSVGLE